MQLYRDIDQTIRKAAYTNRYTCMAHKVAVVWTLWAKEYYVIQWCGTRGRSEDCRATEREWLSFQLCSQGVRPWQTNTGDYYLSEATRNRSHLTVYQCMVSQPQSKYSCMTGNQGCVPSTKHPLSPQGLSADGTVQSSSVRTMSHVMDVMKCIIMWYRLQWWLKVLSHSMCVRIKRKILLVQEKMSDVLTNKYSWAKILC